jgi:hypothetical protein
MWRQIAAGRAHAQRIWGQRDLRRHERRICDHRRMTAGENKAIESYVRAALAQQGYAFDEAHIAEIVLQFSRLEAIAQTVFELPLPFGSEPAPVFRP